MSTHLQWAIINKFNATDIKKAGSVWTKEKGHLKGKKSLKYCTLVNPGSKSFLENSVKCRISTVHLEKLWPRTEML